MNSLLWLGEIKLYLKMLPYNDFPCIDVRPKLPFFKYVVCVLNIFGHMNTINKQ